jgi:hypothetical protein
MDLVISVGYPMKSQRGIQFRIWASGVLRDHLIKGVTLNQERIQELKETQLDEFRETLAVLESAKHLWRLHFSMPKANPARRT